MNENYISNTKSEQIAYGFPFCPIDHKIYVFESDLNFAQEILNDINLNTQNPSHIITLLSKARFQVNELETVLDDYSKFLRLTRDSQDTSNTELFTKKELSAYRQVCCSQINYHLLNSQLSMDELITHRITFEKFQSRKGKIYENISDLLDQLSESTDNLISKKQEFLISVLSQEKQMDLILENITDSVMDLEKRYYKKLNKALEYTKLNSDRCISGSLNKFSMIDIAQIVTDSLKEISKVRSLTTLKIYSSLISPFLIFPLFYANYNGMPLAQHTSTIVVIILFVLTASIYLFLGIVAINGLIKSKFYTAFKISALHILTAVLMYFYLSDIPVKSNSDTGLIWVMIIMAFVLYFRAINAYISRESYSATIHFIKKRMPSIINNYSQIFNILNK